jgi:hypothetical protein
MAMTKKLHSISALAVELDRDRRTIAAALKEEREALRAAAAV